MGTKRRPPSGGRRRGMGARTWARGTRLSPYISDISKTQYTNYTNYLQKYRFGSTINESKLIVLKRTTSDKVIKKPKRHQSRCRTESS
ncbi:hypothetical protein EVAR_8043_1 [Eumeta japonica]|uniref:Uncharacterized protein n=1 Tax=Eumeta variegata TaxID=151549 RepID=A0A4C1TJR3_EUMVA|nr:hypothetical protein EVAR_8043_1 [Eumeta japonica]